MTFALLILVGAWALTTLMVVSLCRLAKQGDRAQRVHVSRPPARRRLPRRSEPHRTRRAACR